MEDGRVVEISPAVTWVGSVEVARAAIGAVLAEVVLAVAKILRA
jgi:hypothetical protein